MSEVALPLPGKSATRRWGITHAVLSTALSSIAIVYQASATKALNPLLLAALSNLAGGAIIFSLIAIGRKLPSKELLGRNFRDLCWLAFLRAFSGAILFWVGLSLTLGVKAMFFTKAEPYFILAWDWLFERKKVPRKHLLLLLIHVCGAVLLSSGSFHRFDRTQIGDLLLVVAVAVLGLSYRFGARLSNSLGVFQTISISQLLGGSCLLPLALLTGGMAFHPEAHQAWSFFLLSILLWNVLGASFWMLALREVDTWVVSALRALGPLVAAPIAWICFDETLTPLQMLGGSLVLCTSFLIARESRSAKNRAA